MLLSRAGKLEGCTQLQSDLAWLLQLNVLPNANCSESSYVPLPRVPVVWHQYLLQLQFCLAWVFLMTKVLIYVSVKLNTWKELNQFVSMRPNEAQFLKDALYMPLAWVLVTWQQHQLCLCFHSAWWFFSSTAFHYRFQSLVIVSLKLKVLRSCFTTSSHISLHLPLSQVLSSYRSALLYTAVFGHTDHMIIPAKFSFLHITSGVSYA